MNQNEKTTVVYSCSGCADVGEVADQIGRKLRRDGLASHKASCIVGIGAGLAPFIDAAKAADTVITIDGVEQATTLNKGQFLEMVISSTKVVESNKPILTVQYFVKKAEEAQKKSLG